jgi:hypothetical protein
MSAPAFSTFSALAELFVTAAVFYIIVSNFFKRPFAWRLAAGVIIFEFSVNMLYMISRMREVPEEAGASSPYALFAAAHGTLSLLMFVLLVVFSFLARSADKRGEFYFHDRPKLTVFLLTLWGISVVSGELLYIVNYW